MEALYDLARDGITQSILTGWLRCREYTRLDLIEGWTTIVPKPTFMFGDLTHGVLEHVYGQAEKYRKRGNPPTLAEISDYVKEQLKLWKVEHGMVSEDTLEHLHNNAALARTVLPHYFQFWFKKDFLETKWLGLEKEFEFELDVHGFPLKIRGKRDGDLHGPKLFETKTKSQIDEKALYDLLNFDFQTDVYSLSMEKDYGAYPTGVRYNIIRKPALKRNKSEAMEAFLRRVNDDILSKPDHYFKRYNIYRPPSSLKKFRLELVEICHEFILWYQKKRPNYKNTTSCQSKFGTCAMIQICANSNFKAFHKRKKVFKELSYKREGL